MGISDADRSLGISRGSTIAIALHAKMVNYVLYYSGAPALVFMDTRLGSSYFRPMASHHNGQAIAAEQEDVGRSKEQGAQSKEQKEKARTRAGWKRGYRGFNWF